MTNHAEDAVAKATRIIRACEAHLERELTTGERRDLLKDNTNWTPATVEAVVAIVNRRQEGRS